MLVMMMKLMMRIGKTSMLDKKPTAFSHVFGQSSNIKTLLTSRYYSDGSDFNMAAHIGDNPESVAQARRSLDKLLPKTPAYLNQTHSTICINLDQYTQNIEADAIWTTRRNLPIAIMTADCLPIIITNQAGEFVAGIHAGWKGLLAGIIQNTMTQLAAQFDPQLFQVFIAPHICHKCFEVGIDVYQKFVAQDNNNTKYFTQIANDKYLANLSGIASNILHSYGITEISNKHICTRCHNNWFYSYRIDQNNGRIATIAWIE